MEGQNQENLSRISFQSATAASFSFPFAPSYGPFRCGNRNGRQRAQEGGLFDGLVQWHRVTS